MHSRVVALSVLIFLSSAALAQMRIERPPEPPRFPTGPGQGLGGQQQNLQLNNNQNYNLQSPNVNGLNSQSGSSGSQGDSSGSQATGDDRLPMDQAADELDTIDINSLPCIKKIGRVL